MRSINGGYEHGAYYIDGFPHWKKHDGNVWFRFNALKNRWVFDNFNGPCSIHPYRCGGVLAKVLKSRILQDGKFVKLDDDSVFYGDDALLPPGVSLVSKETKIGSFKAECVGDNDYPTLAPTESPTDFPTLTPTDDPLKLLQYHAAHITGNRLDGEKQCNNDPRCYYDKYEVESSPCKNNPLRCQQTIEANCTSMEIPISCRWVEENACRAAAMLLVWMRLRAR